MRPVKATVPVGKFEFGKIDGKKEARSPIFESIFYNGDGYFDDLTNDTNKYIIYGRKGTGKTLLVQYFLKQKSKEKNVFSRMVPPTSFSERKLAQFDYAGLKPEETEVFWKFVILKELSSIVLENERGVLNRKKLNKLRDVDSQLSMQLTEIVEENSNEISATMATSNLSVSGKNGVSSKSSFKVGKYYDKIDELSNNLKQVLETSKFTYFIAFDDLDELKTGVFVTLTAAKRIEKLAALLVDFVYALEEINDMLYEIGSNTRVLTTLRKDVVEQMQKLGSNINKPLTDSGIEINWFSPIINKHPEKSSLGKLIGHKIKGSVPEYSELNEEEIVSLIFGYSKRGGAFDWIVKRGFGRPRDIISLLNYYKKQFPEDKVINFHNLTQIQSVYSHWFYSELQNEIHLLENEKSIHATILLIKKLKKTTFNFADLKDLYSVNRVEFDEIDDLAKSVRSLYDLGVLANQDFRNPSNPKQKPIIEYAYRDGENQADFSTNFIVHPAIRNFLSI